MENKQTAIGVLYLKLLGIVSLDSEKLRDVYENIFIEAKAMEKEQISNAYFQGLMDGMNNSPKQYYEETYGK